MVLLENNRNCNVKAPYHRRVIPLQMMGRAGRPQYDDHGVAVVLVHDVKKHFYKKFLYEPFPVESSLHGVLPDHLNAEIVAGTIQVKIRLKFYLMNHENTQVLSVRWFT